MAAAKPADLAWPRPLESCCRVPALDGHLWAGERAKLRFEPHLPKVEADLRPAMNTITIVT